MGLRGRRKAGAGVVVDDESDSLLDDRTGIPLELRRRGLTPLA